MSKRLNLLCGDTAMSVVVIDDLLERWLDAVRSDVRERLLTMSEDDFIADAMYRAGLMSNEEIRGEFLSIVTDEVFAIRNTSFTQRFLVAEIREFGCE